MPGIARAANVVATQTLIAARHSSLDRVRRLLVLTSAIVFFDTMFFAALTPLLPHYVHALGLDKSDAGVLAGAYPAGVLVAAIPSGMVAARLGAKRTVLAGLVAVAACTVLFGVAGSAWELDLARFSQGLASAFSWTGALAWLVAAAPAGRRGAVIGTAFAAAAGGALFGPVLGGVASKAGIGWTFAVVAAASLALAGWAVLTRADRPERPQPISMLLRAFADSRVLLGFWFVTLPALLFGTVSVLGPLRLAHLGLGSVAIAAVFLGAAAMETVANPFIGRAADRFGPLAPARLGLVGSIVVAALLPFVNLAWAPGQSIGSAGGGALAHVTADAVPYLLLSGVCALTLGALWRSGASTGWTTSSARASSGSSARTTGAG